MFCLDPYFIKSIQFPKNMVDIVGLTIILGTATIFSLIGVLYSKRKNFSAENFISAKKSSNLKVTVATLVASAMGVWILFSPAESSVTWGITALLGYAIGSAGALIIFSWLGFKMRSVMPHGHALTEFVYYRFGKAMYLLILIIILFYMSVFLAAELTGISLAANLVFDIPLVYTSTIVGLGALIYTAMGGIRASIFTDRFQHMIMIPLLIIIFVFSLSFLGGFENIFTKASNIDPKILDFNNGPGIGFAITLVIAIIGANLFHQGYWQRAYIAKNSVILKSSFMIAGLIAFFMILIAGSFGIFAVAQNVADNPSVSLFTFIQDFMPQWAMWLVMILGIALVMSSIDTLLNGIISLFTVDLARIKPSMKSNNLLGIAKWGTVVIAGISILVSTQGFSVLYLFLIADLVCVAAAFPTFYGLYSRKLNGYTALISTLSGIFAGVLIFPPPDFSSGNLLYSYLIALIVPMTLSIIFSFIGKKFDFSELAKKVKPLGR
jgi:Na+/proline symporter